MHAYTHRYTNTQPQAQEGTGTQAAHSHVHFRFAPAGVCLTEAHDQRVPSCHRHVNQNVGIEQQHATCSLVLRAAMLGENVRLWTRGGAYNDERRVERLRTLATTHTHSPLNLAKHVNQRITHKRCDLLAFDGQFAGMCIPQLNALLRQVPRR